MQSSIHRIHYEPNRRLELARGRLLHTTIIYLEERNAHDEQTTDSMQNIGSWMSRTIRVGRLRHPLSMNIVSKTELQQIHNYHYYSRKL